MPTFSLITAFVSAVIASLFSGFPGILPILLFVFLLLFNLECVAANGCEEDQTSMLFMAVICSAMVALLCLVTVSSSVTEYLTELGLLDPDRLHPAIPIGVIITSYVILRIFLRKARKKGLLVQKYGYQLMKAIDERTYNPRLKRIRRMMIKEGTLTEKMFDEEE